MNTNFKKAIKILKENGVMTLISKIFSKIENYSLNYLGVPRIKGADISKRFIKRYLPKNPIIVDCGAYDGRDSVQLVNILGGQVHAFEPIPEIYKQLCEKAKGHNIKCYPIALGDKIGKSFFYVSSGASNASSSLLPPKEHLVDHPEVTFNEKVEIDVITLDKWAADNKISHVDMLWLDMQGFELRMLKASENVLPTVKVIHTEINRTETYDGAGLYGDIKDYLETMGFEMVIETDANVLFVKRNT